MFNKRLIMLTFLLSVGCFNKTGFAEQFVTAETFYEEQPMTEYENQIAFVDENQTNMVLQEVPSEVMGQSFDPVPVWPLVGTDADMDFVCNGSPEECAGIDSRMQMQKKSSNIFSLQTTNQDTGWSGGANIIHTQPMPAGFMDECNTRAEMPLMAMEMMEDDGGNVLAVSRNSHDHCSKTRKIPILARQNPSAMFMAQADEQMMDTEPGNWDISDLEVSSADKTFANDASNAPNEQIQSWIVESGKTMRSVLEVWANREGWDLVWATTREYPIEANAVFKGRFVDVASALVRNFARATPVPYAKFYKGNKVIVISTVE